MKTLFYYLQAAIILLMLTACSDQKPAEQQTTEVNCKINDRKVPFLDVMEWVINWGDLWIDQLGEEHASYGSWGEYFTTDMSTFVDVIKDYDRFRVYYGICPDAGNTGLFPSLLLAPIDDDCNRIDQNCIYKFDANPNFCESDACSGGDYQVSLVEATEWTDAFRGAFDISTEDSIIDPFGTNKFLVPLAFNYRTDSFLVNFDTLAPTLYAYPVLEPAPAGNDDYDYSFKIVYGGAAFAPPNKAAVDYIDFANPCPQACGTTLDPLLGN